MSTLERAYRKLHPDRANFPIVVQPCSPSLSEQDETTDCDLVQGLERLSDFVISPPNLRFHI